MDLAPDVAPPAPGAARHQIGQRTFDLARQYLGVGSTFLLVVLFFSITQPVFFTWENILNVLRSNSVLLLAALGMTFVILGGGFDLSIGSLAALAGVALAIQLQAGIPVGIAVISTLAGCFLLGFALNGLLIGRLGFNFFVVTLATLSILRGAALLLSNGLSASTFEWPLVQFLGDGNLAGVPVPAVITLVFYVLAYVVLRNTQFGRMVYAVGGNAEAARLSGIDVPLVRALLYGISGLMAGVAGIVLTGRLTSSQPVTGAIGLELSAAAAVLLGGTSFTGGVGGVVGTVIGALYIGVLQNGLSIAGVPSFWQNVATGLILLLAVAFHRLNEFNHDRG